MSSETVGNRAVRQARWIVAAQLASRLVPLLSTLIVSRILGPSDYGLVNLSGILIGVAGLLQDLGLSRVLLSRPEDRLGPACNAAFHTSLLSGGASYAALLLLAWPLAAWFKTPELPALLAVAGMSLVVNAASVLPLVLLTRRAAFQALFWLTLVPTLFSSALIVSFALAGAGAWALVMGPLLAGILRLGGLWRVEPWRPRLRLSGDDRLERSALLRAGGWLSFENLLNWGADSLLLLSVGGVLGTRALGIYNLCFEAARMPYWGITALSGSVGMTGYAELLARKDELCRVLDKALRFTHTFAFPASIGMVVLSPWIVPVVWGARWLDAIPVLALLGLVGIASQTANVVAPLLLGLGLLRHVTLLAAVRAAGFVAVAWAISGFGLTAVAIAHLALLTASSVATCALVFPRIGFRPGSLVASTLMPLVRALVMGAVVWLFASAWSSPSPIAVLAGSVPLGMAVYAALLYLSDREAFGETASVLLRAIGRSAPR